MEIDRKELDYVPYDKYFEGTWYSSTGYAVLFENDSVWWNEYENDDGDIRYF